MEAAIRFSVCTADAIPDRTMPASPGQDVE
jgi:hypothetical protein